MARLESTVNGPLGVGEIDLPAIAGSPKNLPNEVLLIIFKLLTKPQLKAVRCVCKLFARLAAPPIFDKIYISPHKLNLDVFRKIADHPDLCQYPRTLVYDVQEFKKTIDPQKYYRGLCSQLYSFLAVYPKDCIRHVDKELEGLLGMAKGHGYYPKSEPEGYELFFDCRIVQRGLELYLEKAQEQDHYNNSGELLACLCTGLMKLSNVDNVQFQTRWTTSHLVPIEWSKSPRDLPLASSPLARVWSPFHLQPDFSMKLINLEFDNLISAFSLTGRPLRSLDAHNRHDVAYEMFHSKSRLSRTFRQHGFPALYHLESLSLGIDMTHHSESRAGEMTFGGPNEKTLSVDVLTHAIHSIPGLRNLTLIGNIHDNGNGLISMDELFHTSGLPALEALDLTGMLGSATQISVFLRARPRLRRLKLQTIELSEGTWAGLVDDMRKHRTLNSLDLRIPLREELGIELWDEDDWYDSEMADQIESYVLNGGKNPLRAARYP
ncbi:hypothetical protein MMC07_002176 [Pseudocyphellaria aurata]|nr:hypothetical protein [Pseudocyphellaria aurata]